MISVGPPLLLPLYFHYEVIYFCIKRRDYLVRVWDWRCCEELPFIGVAASLAHQLLLVFKSGGTKDSSAGPVLKKTSWRVCEGLQTLHKHFYQPNTLCQHSSLVFMQLFPFMGKSKDYKSHVCDCEWMKHQVLLINFMFYVSNLSTFNLIKCTFLCSVFYFTYMHIF